MAIKKKDEAILRKVENILENSQNRKNIYIHVHDSFDELTTISYNVTEYIIPEENNKVEDNTPTEENKEAEDKITCNHCY